MNYCLPLSGTFTLLFFRYAIAVLLVGAYFSLRSEWHWPDQRSLLIGFLGHLIGGFGENHHMAKTASRAALPSLDGLVLMA